ncbi:MAG: hypothetical protein WCY97_03295 [Methanothrix sp.]|uniref:Uncharacterized protein n=1 Tax=Methanothrix harundinacea TaxID=301375 RepID=A0A101IMM8_9EURY|nr:MAG: hypothetical protein APR56_13090 [Methanosaeta sp. SDB]KUK43925.1 MAG: Uncharacterized protein XD72_1692 [Methanothrix harundinacea]MDD2637657.1 hypothetical protein [Methanothrix sp.]MDI9399690.1 hypothetical protein [Euryarchaeota archaeon]KUK97680.1 MAG: Uncharacterized protein XE07_0094 [Methanothrix harundinacea]
MKIMKIYAVLAMIISVMTTAHSSPFEDVPVQRRHFSEADILEPIALDGRATGPRPGLGEERPPDGPFRAEGVALERGETYFLHIWLIDTKQIPPAVARDLLRENRSLDEIREEISKSEGKTTIRGGMILGDDRFILVNISQIAGGDSSVLEADLVEFDHMMRSAEDLVMGHIVIETREVGGAQVGEGNLTLNVDDESSSYRLTFLPPQTVMDQNGEASGGDHVPGRDQWS